MSNPTKATSLQAYRLVLYRKALHPELFKIRARRTIQHQGYDFEAWLMRGSHLMRFQDRSQCATELITDQEEGLPERGLVVALPCAGERDHEEDFGSEVKFVSTVQTEQLPESLYKATYDELVEFGAENEALITEWTDNDGGRCASILDIQRYRNEIHAQSYHLQSPGGVVLRTQTIFERVKG